MMIRANKVQVNPCSYVKDFIGDPEKWQDGIFQDGLITQFILAAEQAI